MPNIRQCLVLSTLILGAACTPLIDVTSQPVDVNFTPAANQPALRGYDTTYVRSYIAGPDNSKTETAGVACTFSGSGFNGSVTTPGIVNLPAFGTGTRPVAFTCSDGNTTIVSQAVPYNVTSNERMAAGASGGLIGVLIMAGVDAARDSTADTWGYRDVVVIYGN